MELLVVNVFTVKENEKDLRKDQCKSSYLLYVYKPFRINIANKYYKHLSCHNMLPSYHQLGAMTPKLHFSISFLAFLSWPLPNWNSI